MLQVVAWSQMLASYTAEKGLVKGIEETFDGEHGCSMCKLIEEGQENERRDNPALPTRLELIIKTFPAANVTTLSFRHTETEQTTSTFAAPLHMKSQWSSAPDAPPPRLA